MIVPCTDTLTLCRMPPWVHCPEGQVPRCISGSCSVSHLQSLGCVALQVVLPADTDPLGICFGGQVLSWIDICAGLAAKAVARGPCVTASVDAVHFLRPCRVSSVAIVAAMVNRTFQSSMEVCT